MHSKHNEGNSVVAERFTRTLKNKIYKHITAISKNVHFNVLMILLVNKTIHTIEPLK